MRPFGLSTGALALGDFDRALAMLHGVDVAAIELSALRVHELPSLLSFAERADLSRFSYISVHAPTDYSSDQEPRIAEQLAVFTEKNWPIVVHPDVMSDRSVWRPFGSLIYVENMDKRKPAGRTAEELMSIFDDLPDAQMCFDIAHARQFDTSMTEAYRIVRTFRDRIKQVHISEVNTSSKHDLISPNAVHAFQSVAFLIPRTAPAILEAPVKADQLRDQLALAAESLESGS